ncbi:RNA polymerase sigma-70 factor, ECF subfamily [Noviherbaspirillum suwonense]|uniref:RNA polymerase sigma factor n=1 Tax=Noviherbaspirillum suwonense TaxID=1224511 RepID=A0ABY1QA57_9BURK|nr:RNA polymerase sigma-70 factor, ECF subfamily [Noviherbaspirillum suwonense]
MATGAVRKAGHAVSDSEIIRRVLAGDRNAFELLMRRYNRPLYRTARSIVTDDAEAEDVLQEAYLLAFHNLEKFRGESTTLTWLTRIVVNNAIARSRKIKRRAEIIAIGSEPDWETHPASASLHLDSTEQPEQAMERSAMRRLIEKKIDDLPETFRTVFMLRALEEMSVEDTSACLGIPEATVRTRYFRAKGLLREALSREMDFALEGAFSFDGARCDRIVSGVFSRLGGASGDHA